MKKKKTHVSQASVNAFAKKLEAWGKTIPADERKLLRLLLDRAAGVQIEDLGDYDTKVKIRPESLRIFRALKQVAGRLAGGEVWLEIGEIWLRANKRQMGEL